LEEYPIRPSELDWQLEIELFVLDQGLEVRSFSLDSREEGDYSLYMRISEKNSNLYIYPKIRGKEVHIFYAWHISRKMLPGSDFHFSKHFVQIFSLSIPERKMYV
jgi:hypothetical protein